MILRLEDEASFAAIEAMWAEIRRTADFIEVDRPKRRCVLCGFDHVVRIRFYSPSFPNVALRLIRCLSCMKVQKGCITDLPAYSDAWFDALYPPSVAAELKRQAGEQRIDASRVGREGAASPCRRPPLP